MIIYKIYDDCVDKLNNYLKVYNSNNYNIQYGCCYINVLYLGYMFGRAPLSESVDILPSPASVAFWGNIARDKTVFALRVSREKRNTINKLKNELGLIRVYPYTENFKSNYYVFETQDFKNLLAFLKLQEGI